MLDEALKNVCVLGAGGKMGSGISLLLLLEIARLEAQLTGNLGTYKIYLIDSSPKALEDLRPYLHEQLLKYAEKNIVEIRNYFVNNPSLVSNEEIIQYFVEKALSLAHFDTDILQGRNSSLIFEAILEDVEVKAQAFRTLAKDSTAQSFYFSNTSSIPIHLLSEKAKLEDKIIGYHFYNPPAVQKLLEVIIPEKINPNLKIIAEELAKRLQKIVVYSHDIAGFIGNGHFMREVIFACNKVQELTKEHSLNSSLYLINKVTQDFLIRPMGIFQLMDYVGIDVCQHICKIMSYYLPDNSLHSPLIDRMIADGIIGGQRGDGSQKDGFFQYQDHQIKGIYSLDDHQYLPIQEDWAEITDQFLSSLPEGYASWKHLNRDPHRDEKLKIYFQNLFKECTPGATLAQLFLINSREIARYLVENKVADSMEDVDTVLKQGFFHLYGPDASWMKVEVL